MQTRSILVGLVGAGIRSSLSPRLHELEGEHQDLRYIYKLIDLDVLGLSANDLPEILTAAERFGFSGLNITYPCKQAILEQLDELSSDARAIGAVNSVVFRGGRRVGHNTDWSGFAAAFRRALPDVARNRVVQFGAGGAGAAVAHALLTLDVGRLILIDTNRERALELAGSLCMRFGGERAVAVEDAAEAMAVADGLVNTTPMGMEKFPGMAVPPALLSPDVWVADVVYFPIETDLLREAKERGCRTMSGGGMAVFQAAEAFRLFTDIEPDTTRMLRHFAEIVGEF
jgi:shikimate dehydrogenase